MYYFIISFLFLLAVLSFCGCISWCVHSGNCMLTKIQVLLPEMATDELKFTDSITREITKWLCRNFFPTYAKSSLKAMRPDISNEVKHMTYSEFG